MIVCTHMTAYMRAATTDVRPTLFSAHVPNLEWRVLRLAYTHLPAATRYATGHVRTHASDLGGPELGLVDLDALPGGALAAGLLLGAQAALLPHLAVPLMHQLLASLPPAAAPCMQTSRTIKQHFRSVWCWMPTLLQLS